MNTKHSRKIDWKPLFTTPWGIAFITYFVTMGLVGALTPADILTAYEWTRPFTDFMASIVPQIDKVTALGIDPDINRFYFSVMWAGSPILGLISVLAVWSGGKLHLESLNDVNFGAFRAIVIPLLILIFGGVLSYHVEWSIDPKMRLTASTFGTHIGRLGMPQSFVLVPVMCGFSVFTRLLGWLTGYIPCNIRKQHELENSHGE